MQDFRRLRVWGEARKLAISVREAGRAFPSHGYGDLKVQMVRAAESVLFNIAEGCGAATSKDFARFLSISSKSTMELESQIDLATAYGILSPNHSNRLSEQASTVRRMVWGLRAKVLCEASGTGNGHG